MKLIFATFCLFLIIVSSKAQNAEFDWARRSGGTSGRVDVQNIAVDLNNNAYSVGYFTDNADFNPSAGFAFFNTVGNYDIFIQKLDSIGNFVWAKQMGGTDYDEGLAITTDLNGNVYTTGYFQNTVDFDPNAGVVNLTASNFHSIFIQKLDPNGNLVWVKQLDGPFGTVGKAIVTDANNNVYIAGNFAGTVDFDPNAGVMNLTSSGASDGFIQKLDQNGNLIWVKQISGMLTISIEAIALDNNGNPHLTGYFTGTADFDPNGGVTNLTSLSTVSNDGDIFVQKLNAAGQLVWVKQMGGTEDEEGTSITVDNNGNVYTVGFFENSIDFDPSSTGNNTFTAVGQIDGFVQKLDVNGNFIWANQIGGSGRDAALGIDVDPSQQAYITGQFSSMVDFDPDLDTLLLTSLGNRDIFIQKLDQNGSLVWVKQMGSTGFDSGQSIALGNSGGIYSNGSFTNTVDFDPGTNTFSLAATGFQDLYVHKLAQPNLLIVDYTPSFNASLYPNPSNHYLTVELEEAQGAMITILDQQGRLVHPSIITNKQKTLLALETLPQGIYYVSIQTKKGLTIKKWIKQ